MRCSAAARLHIHALQDTQHLEPACVAMCDGVRQDNTIPMIHKAPPNKDVKVWRKHMHAGPAFAVLLGSTKMMSPEPLVQGLRATHVQTQLKEHTPHAPHKHSTHTVLYTSLLHRLGHNPDSPTSQHGNRRRHTRHMHMPHTRSSSHTLQSMNGDPQAACTVSKLHTCSAP